MNVDFKLLNTEAIKIFSDNKATRQVARSQLVELFKKNVLISAEHLKGHPQLSFLYRQVLNMRTKGTFDYRINQVGSGDIKIYDGLVPPLAERTPVNNSIGFVAMMSHCPVNIEQPNVDLLLRQVTLLEEEGFKATPEESRAQAAQDLRIVVGVNRVRTAIPRINRLFKAYARSLVPYCSGRTSMYAFFWSPEWIDSSGKTYAHKSIKRLVRVLLDISPLLTEVAMARIFADKVVPFQHIRQHIKDSDYVLAQALALRHGNREKKLGLLTCDDDAFSLNTSDKGLFCHYKDALEANPQAELITTGYFMKDRVNNSPYVEFATRTELENRRGGAHILPSGFYPPEPNILAMIGRNTSESIKRLSYVNSKGTNLESLNLMRSMDLMKVNTLGRMVFWYFGEIETAMPPRFEITKTIPALLNKHGWNHEKVLASLRKIPQSSLFSRSFAESTTRTIGGSAALLKNSTHVGNIYKCYDAIQYCKKNELPNWIELYRPFVQNLNEIFQLRRVNPACNIDFDQRAANIVGITGTDVVAVKDYLTIVVQKLHSSMHSMVKDEVFTYAQAETLRRAAECACRASYEYIRASILNTPYVSPFAPLEIEILP